MRFTQCSACISDVAHVHCGDCKWWAPPGTVLKSVGVCGRAVSIIPARASEGCASGQPITETTL